MADLRQAAQQALEALEQCGLNDTHRSYQFEHAARAALRAALAQEEQILNSAYESACKIISEQDKKLKELEAVNAELLAALNNIETSTHDAMTAALARVAIAKAEEQK